jgi:ribosomal protein S18 acetylase RimI-like enzyme
MISVCAIAAADASTLRDIRLRALLDSPLAFGSTYAKESVLTDSEWLAKAARWTEPNQAATFLAVDADECCGIVACFKDQQVAGRLWLVSMWVAPQARRKHVGQQLVAEVVTWATQHGSTHIMLHVTEGNTPAIEFYLRCGFEFTGESIPHTHAAGLRELEMVRRVATSCAEVANGR